MPMLKTATTNQLFDTESTLWSELSDAQAQSTSGGLNTALPITFSSITSLPASQPSPLNIQPQQTPFAIPSYPGR